MTRNLKPVASQSVNAGKKAIAILAIAVGFAAAAPTAAMAKSSAAQARAAHAQAIENVTEGGADVSPERVRALRECNSLIAGYRGYNSLGLPSSIYRNCMNEHGQPE